MTTDTNFEQYWTTTWNNGTLPGIFETAMKEIVYKAWCAGVDSVDTQQSVKFAEIYNPNK